MLIEKDTIRCEAVFNEQRTHRYLWKRVWDKNQPMAAVLMLNPCLSDNIITDTTTTLVVNNIAKTEKYGGVEIVNLYSMLTSKLNFRWNAAEELNDKENDSYILQAAEECEIMVLAWGTAANKNPNITQRIAEVQRLLKPYEAKLFEISDGEQAGLHPLAPAVRADWELVKVTFPEKTDEP